MACCIAALRSCSRKRWLNQQSADRLAVVFIGYVQVPSTRDPHLFRCSRDRQLTLRCLTTTAAATASEKQQPQQAALEEEEIYKGSLTAPIKTLKRVSITTCAMSIVGMPALFLVADGSVALVGRLAITGTALLTAVGSTALLHWFTKPYIHRMVELKQLSSSPKSGNTDEVVEDEVKLGKERTFRIEQLNIFSRPSFTTFRLNQVDPRPNAQRPFMSFMVQDGDADVSHGTNGNSDDSGSGGGGGKKKEDRKDLVGCFIQGELLKDKQLLQKLLGRPLKDHEVQAPP